MAISERQLLDSLSRTPFIDSAELARILGEAHATVHRALADLLAGGIVGRVSHGTAHLPSSQRYHLTADGIGETSGILGFATPSDFVRAYPVSREWLTLLIRRMDAVAAVYRLAASLSPGIPPKSAPAEYTRFFVDEAINRYETQGLDATLAHYNRAESVDGQWYMFIIDENDLVVGHPDSLRLGLDLNGWVGTDFNGYQFGPDMLSATEEGKWVSYVYENPESGGIGSDNTGALQLKNAWVVRHDGLLFGSGWYVSADEFTKALVAAAVEAFRAGGLAGVIAYFASPDVEFAGLRSAIEYYNSADNVEGDWFAFLADKDGTIIDHYHREMVGRSLDDVFGADAISATAEGSWVTTEDMRVWVVGDNGMTFGSGWHRDHEVSGG